MTTAPGLGPHAARRFALLAKGPAGAPADPDAITTPTEDVAGSAEVALPERLEALPVDVRADLDGFAALVDSSALVVLHEGAVVHEWYAPRTGRDSLRQSQSMHKSVLGVVVLRVIEQGLLPGLDSPASTWLPEWADDERAVITIDHLLRMESGLSQPGMSMDPATAAFQWLFGDHTTPVVLAFPAAGPPATRFEYNNLNAQVLGILLERATGERYAALLSRLLWHRLGAAPARVWLDSEGGSAATSCCLAARAYDWALFGEVLRTHGSVAGRTVLTAELIDTLTEVSPRSRQYARQIWLGDGMNAAAPAGGLSPIGRTTAAEPFLERGTIVACGFGGQRVYVARDHGVVLVRMGDPNGTVRFSQHWDDTRLLNTVLRAVR